MTNSATQALLNQVLDLSRNAGADHAVVIVQNMNESTLRFALNRVTQHIQNEEISLDLAVAVDNREAVVSTNSTENSDLVELAERAVTYARSAPSNPEFVKPISPQKYSKTQTWYDSTASIDIETRGQTVKDICDYARSKNVDLFGNLNISLGELSVANSEGLFVSQPFTDVELNTTARTKTKGGSGRKSVSEGDWDRVQPQMVAEESIQTAIESQDPIKIPPGQYVVILSPDAVLEYLMYMVFSMDSRQAELGQSFFSKKSGKGTRIGEKLFGSGVTIKSVFDHPQIPTLSFGAPFGSGGSDAGTHFNYGLPMKNHTWIMNGTVTQLRDSPYWAMKNKRKAVACPFNIVMAGTDSSIEEIILGTERGVYISSFWYTGPTDMNKLELTGLTRDGTFLIEKGEISKPLVNFRFNDSPVNSLNRLAAIGRAEKVKGEYIVGMVPCLKFDSFNLSSVSEAI